MKDDTIGLSRRKMLVGLGAVGVASAGAGLGTTAYFNDTETFENNTLTAGELNLIVDWATYVDQGSYGSSATAGEMDGNTESYDFSVGDVKPGDSGTLAFCPKIVDNPGYLWIGSENGVTDYENGQPEPEMAPVDNSSGGSIGGSNDGAGAGELSENILVTVSYASGITVDEQTGEITCTNETELNNPADYTFADLAAELEAGFLIDPIRDANVDPYPASSDASEQAGPCLCIHWEVPTEVGNWIQTDALEMDFGFVAMQARHNGGAGNSTANPFNSSS
jgi:predicted ribosomally synthesized peptide with SipW-like signal peptide